MPHISVISPVYQAQFILDELVLRIVTSIEKITLDYEIVLVDDGSVDDSWAKIEEHCITNKKIVGLKLSRNFGQHYTITAGLDQSKGDWVVVMDCDLQDQPEEIENLYKKANEGYDIVLASRFERKDRVLKKLFSMIFYRTLGYLTGSEQDETVANFGIYNRKVINAIVSMRESIRYFPTMVKWVGFKSTKINVTHSQRLEGKSNYNYKKLLNLALDIILAFSDKPLRLLIKFGLIISFISFIVALNFFNAWLNGAILVMGYTSIIISIWLLSGIIISTLGVVGLYVGKTFEGVKGRPLYIVSDKIND